MNGIRKDNGIRKGTTLVVPKKLNKSWALALGVATQKDIKEIRSEEALR